MCDPIGVLDDGNECQRRVEATMRPTLRSHPTGSLLGAVQLRWLAPSTARALLGPLLAMGVDLGRGIRDLPPLSRPNRRRTHSNPVDMLSLKVRMGTTKKPPAVRRAAFVLS